jgi:hypothetical protein
MVSHKRSLARLMPINKPAHDALDTGQALCPARPATWLSTIVSHSGTHRQGELRLDLSAIVSLSVMSFCRDLCQEWAGPDAGALGETPRKGVVQHSSREQTRVAIETVKTRISEADRDRETW